MGAAYRFSNSARTQPSSTRRAVGSGTSSVTRRRAVGPSASAGPAAAAAVPSRASNVAMSRSAARAGGPVSRPRPTT